MPRLGVWNGTHIGAQYRGLADIRDAILALQPPGRWSLEWLVKAGEGGSWQGTWDQHPLAIDSPRTLRALFLEGRGLRPRLLVTPYVVVRGRAEWNEAEREQVAACAAATGRVVLNLEPGDHYWGGPTQPSLLRQDYLAPLEARLRQALRAARRRTASVELCAIPRRAAIEALGGVEAITAWLEFCALFHGSAAWETYDAASPHADGETWECLDVAHAFARLEALGVWGDPQWRIPVVQRSRVAAWARTAYARRGLQVWHLDGD